MGSLRSWSLVSHQYVSGVLKDDHFVYLFYFYLFIYLPQNTNNNEIKQNSNTKANKSGEEAQKKPWGL